MKRLKLYKHKNNTDVAFMPLHIITNKFNDEFEEYIKCKGNWYNIIDIENIKIIGKDKINILNKDLPNWKELNLE